MTNLEIMSLNVKKHGSDQSRQSLEETRQALRDFNRLVESFSYLLKTEVLANREVTLGGQLHKLNELFKMQLLKNISMQVDDNPSYVDLTLAVDIMFLIVAMIRNLRITYKTDDPIEIKVLHKESSVSISFTGRFDQRLNSLLESPQPKSSQIDWFLFLNLAKDLKSKLSIDLSSPDQSRVSFTINTDEVKG